MCDNNLLQYLQNSLKEKNEIIVKQSDHIIEINRRNKRYKNTIYLLGALLALSVLTNMIFIIK